MINLIKTRQQTLLFLFLTLSIFLSFALSNAKAQIEQTIPSPSSQTSIQTVISDQLEAFKQEDNNRAFSHAAPNIRQLFQNADRFITMVKRGYPALYESKLVQYGRIKQLDEDYYQEVIVIDPKGNQWKAVYVLAKQQDGTWKIKGVELNKDTKTAT